VRPYDTIVALDDRPISSDDQLIREISGRSPGSAAHLRVLRDGHEETITLRLAERPTREGEDRRAEPRAPPAPADRKVDQDLLLGLTVRDLDRQIAARLDVPRLTKGVLITRVEPLSSSFDAGIERGTVLLEINRERIESAGDYRRLVRAARPGDILTLYIYSPELEQRQLKTVRVEDR